MGLDTVELIMTVEDAFQIRLADEDVGAVVTAGDLHRLVLSKLPQDEQSGDCLTSGVFYHLRRALIAETGAGRARIVPAAELDSLLPPEDRRRRWRRVASKLDLRLPDLRQPVWVQGLIFVAGLALSSLPFAIGAVEISVPWVAASFIAGLILLVLLFKAAKPLANAIPAECATVGELVKMMVALNHGRLAGRARRWNRDEVWESLRRVIEQQTSVPRGEIKPETSFVADLRMD